MGYGFLSLASFKGQEHVTSVLRAMVVKDEIVRKISLEGNKKLADDIMLAFSYAINCLNPQRGDACGTCEQCQNPGAIVWAPWNTPGARFRIDLVINDRKIDEKLRNVIWYSYDRRDGFLSFSLREAAGEQLSTDFIKLVACAYLGKVESLLKLTDDLSRRTDYKSFVSGLTEVFKTIMFVKANVEIKDDFHVDVIRKIAANFSQHHISACLRLLWDADSKTVLPPELAMQTLSALLSETLHPYPVPDYEVIEADGTPISMVDNNTGQLLDLASMEAIARE